VRDGESTAEAVTDEEGFFEIKDAPPGTYTLQIKAKGARPLSLKEIEILPGEVTDVGSHQLEPGIELTGTVLDKRDGRPVQVVHRRLAPHFARVDLDGLPAACRRAAVVALQAADARRPLDLVGGPLMRATLLRLNPEKPEE